MAQTQFNPSPALQALGNRKQGAKVKEQRRSGSSAPTGFSGVNLSALIEQAALAQRLDRAPARPKPRPAIGPYSRKEVGKVKTITALCSYFR